MSTRTQQIGSIIQRALAVYMLPFEEKHGLIIIVEVIVAPDLGSARVFVDAEFYPIKLIEKLNARSKYFMREISGQLTQRRMPKLQYIVDDTEKVARRIDELLMENKNKSD